jgi:CheY-like chemotaxis protein/DNA-binding Xre family transcriptional regulator
MIKNNEIGAFIHAIREEKGITLREAEAQCGISNSYLNQIETGKVSKPSPEVLRKLSALYGVSYELLLEKSGHGLLDATIDSPHGMDKAASILIIDDNVFDRALIRVLLEKETEIRYAVFEAESGAQGMMVAHEHRPDIILLDYRLGDMDGLEALAKIQSSEKLRDSSVIMLTGYGNEEIAVKALKLGAVNYFNKDLIKEADFLPALKLALKRKSLREFMRSRMDQKQVNQDECNRAIIASAGEILHAASHLGEEFPAIALSADYATVLKETKKIISLFEKESINKG